MKPSIKMPFLDYKPDMAAYWVDGATTVQNALPTLASPNYSSSPSLVLSTVGNINGASYTVNAVKFDGSTNYLDRGAELTGAVGSKSVSFSLWCRIDALQTGIICDIRNASAGAFGFEITYFGGTTQLFVISGYNSSGTQILNVSTVVAYASTTKWLNLLFSANLSTGATNLYVNNVSDKNTITATNDTIDFTKNDCTIGAGTGFSTKFDGALAEIWIAPNQFIDFSVSGNRALFIDSNGFPVNLGSTGQTPTGTAPLIYLKNPATSVGTNSGTGGNFTANGSFSVASSSPSNSTPTQYLGAISTKDSNGIVHTYAGTSNKIAEITSTIATNISKSGGYTATNWEFAQLNNTLYATDFTDPVQSMTVGGTAFANLGGSPPNGTHIAQWNNFIVLGNTNGGTYNGSTQGAVPYRVWGSAIGNPASWPDPLTNAGAAAQAFVQDMLPNYGIVQHLTNGEFYGLVFQENGISIATYVGSPDVFQFNDYEKKIGLYCPNAVVQVGMNFYFPHSSGFYMTNGFLTEPIGHDLVDNTWLTDLNTAYLGHVRGYHDPVNKLVGWCYPSASATLTGGFVTCDKVIVYNYVDKRWGMGMVGQSIDILFNAFTLGYTMEQLDSFGNLDTILPSLDDPFWNGGIQTIGAFGIGQIGTSGSYASYYATLNGTALTATLDTKAVNLNQGGRAMVNAFKPIVMGSSPTIQGFIGTQKLLTDSVTFTAAITPETRTGKCSCRADGVYHRARLVISEGFTNAMGVEPEFTPSGYA